MSADIPHALRRMLDTYIGITNDTLPGLIEALYLHGSIALGAFTPGQSDIDFIAITSRRCTPRDIAALREIHAKLVALYPNMQLEGSYLAWRDLGQSEAGILPHPHIHDGVLHPSGYHDINGITWWILKEHGVTVFGPPAQHLDIQVDWEQLFSWMHGNMDTYWARFTTTPRRMIWLLSDYGIQWAVLGVLRQFYTFRERAVTSKTAAGLYGIEHTPEQWHPLIREAIAMREKTGASSYRCRVTRAIHARAFLQLIVTACRNETT